VVAISTVQRFAQSVHPPTHFSLLLLKLLSRSHLDETGIEVQGSPSSSPFSFHTQTPLMSPLPPSNPPHVTAHITLSTCFPCLGPRSLVPATPTTFISTISVFVNQTVDVFDSRLASLQGTITIQVPV
jgi:hypothetical protein